MAKIAYLKDPFGTIISIFEMIPTPADKPLSVHGVLRSVYEWDLDGAPSQSHLFANVTIKWDGCSHFFFRGEDSTCDADADSYYHVCGVETYVHHMATMAFAYKAFRDVISDSHNMLNDYGKKMEKMVLTFLEGYTLEYKEEEKRNEE